jgi:homopolymeric O-antigen transport system permease protein
LVISAAFTAPSADPRRAMRRRVELVRLSAVRQLRARYRGTAFGVLWSFANPVLTTAIYTALFGTAFARYYGGSQTSYLLSAFVGVVVVTFFLQSTSEALVSVVNSGALLNKIAVEPEIFPVASVAANAFQQMITTFPVIVVIAALETHDPLRVILIPFVAAGIALMSLGFSLALAALYVFFRDLAYLWSIVAFLLWVSSPVFYPPELVPPAVRAFVSVNPVAMAIGALREVTLATQPLHLGLVARFLAASVIVAFAGHALFTKLRSEFMDLL